MLLLPAQPILTTGPHGFRTQHVIQKPQSGSVFNFTDKHIHIQRGGLTNMMSRDANGRTWRSRFYAGCR
jgi:hypothetical protein